MTKKDEITADLKDKGIKVTKYRVALLDVFSKKRKPLAADEIITHLNTKGFEPNKTTIYRELDFLLQEDFIIQIDLGESKKRYELSSLDHHHHLICRKCSKIEDIIIKDDTKELEKKIRRSKKFKVLHHNLEFFGLCYKCQ